MFTHSFPGRVFATCVLFIAIAALSSNTSVAQSTTVSEHDKQIADLEKQIADLQAKVKSLKDPRAPMPREVLPTEEVVPPAWVNKFQWRSIGPATMGGRITSIAVYDADPTTYWVATASGGLLKTINNGLTFEHLFDREATVSIGAVAVAPSNKDIVWIGTGEANPRNSVSFGDGVYKSVDGGKSWKNMGLKTSYQIGDIVIHPTKPDTVYVGALGRLYGTGGERGLFKTEDGGKTWKSILTLLDDKTGVIDIAMHPSNPDTLLVATWERQRDEFDSFRGDARVKTPGGTDEYAPTKVHAPGSAIYKTIDGGKSFTKLTKGLPSVKLGRIGFDWSRKDAKTVFAIVDTEKAGVGKRAYLGLQSETNRGEGGGVTIVSVSGDTPASRAGLKNQDIMTAIGGNEVKSYEAMIQDLQTRRPGEKAKIAITRGKEKMEIEIEFGIHPDDIPKLGIGIDTEKAVGLKINRVVETGIASRAGLKVGDVITAIGDAQIRSIGDLERALYSKNFGDKIKVIFTRGKESGMMDVALDVTPGSREGRPMTHFLLGGQNPNVQRAQADDGFQTGGLFKSTDGGETWTRINSINPRPFYFSVVRVDPTDDNTLWVLGVDLHRSTDGGKTFKADNINKGVHSDQHAMWINPKDGRHIVMGTDGGFYVSYDKGANWDAMTHAGAIGQFYHVAVDNRTPYKVYGGLQDNGSWAGPSRSERWPGPLNSDWLTVSWGDGFVCRVDPNDPDVVYSESQDGNILRNNLRTGTGQRIAPSAGPGLQPFRFNWNTPFILSAHNSSIFYSAGNYVFRSVKRGATLQAVSPEISLTKRGTGTALSESPMNADVVWAGTDDGGVWLTRDGCKTWTNLSDKFKAAGLPGPRWVSSIEASKWAVGRCYVVFDAHRSNDDQPYVFKTDDYGQSWTSLRGNLPVGSTRVLREDIANQNLLYLGTEFACYASINGGKHWTKINGNIGLPTVAVHEFAQPTTANDLVVATHGRSIWVLDVTPLRQMTADIVKGKTTLLSPSPAIQWKRVGTPPFFESSRAFYGQNPARGANIDYVIGSKAEKATITITDVRGNTVREIPGSTEVGYHRATWDLTRGGGGGRRGPEGAKGKGPIVVEGSASLNPLMRGAGQGQLAPGDYRVVLTIDGTQYVQTLVVEQDPSMPRLGIGVRDDSEEIDLLELRETENKEEPPSRKND
jgi:photosystem II stability/assembly factor-like uncharacterized protein